MQRKKRIGFVCFGEINTPFERLAIKHGQALSILAGMEADMLDAGIVIDDAEYKTADAAAEKLKLFEMDCLIVCIAGWVPTHAVIRVTDRFRHTPMLLWGLCGWYENGRIWTTADQAGTTALRPAFEAMGYRFKFVYNIIGEPEPVGKINAFTDACFAAAQLRHARIGTMGYRDMLLYGTQFEGNSLRAQIGVEVEPFEMLEMLQNTHKLSDNEIAKGVAYVKEHWHFEKPCDDAVIERGVAYSLAIGKKVLERGYEAVTLIDVDGMKKLLGFPPAIVFMLLEVFYGVMTTPENDVPGNVTQLMLKYITGQVIPYMEYYEFFKDSVLIGVPDYIPTAVTEGDVKLLPAAFGTLSGSLLNVSAVKTGQVTCARLIYKNGKYYMHVFKGEAKTPPTWAEYGWDQPVPQLPSLEVVLTSCSVEELASKVSSQHVLVSYGDNTEALADLCYLLGIDVI